MFAVAPDRFIKFVRCLLPKYLDVVDNRPCLGITAYDLAFRIHLPAVLGPVVVQIWGDDDEIY